MKKSTKGIIAVIIVIAIIAIIAIILVVSGKSTSKNTNLSDIRSQDDLSNLIDQVYDGVTTDLYNVETRDIDLSDNVSVASYTGLENGDDFEFAVVSEPLINAQPYSFILAKVKDGVNADEVAKEMSEKIDPRKWICVSASKICATSSGNIVFLVMSDEEKTKGVYESFKSIAGTIGQVYEETIEDGELPPDTDTGISIPISE